MRPRPSAASHSRCSEELAVFRTSPLAHLRTITPSPINERETCWKFGSPAWILTKVHGTVLRSASYEAVRIRNRNNHQRFEPGSRARAE
jgi:hypothetical protein